MESRDVNKFDRFLNGVLSQPTLNEEYSKGFASRNCNEFPIDSLTQITKSDYTLKDQNFDERKEPVGKVDRIISDFLNKVKKRNFRPPQKDNKEIEDIMPSIPILSAPIKPNNDQSISSQIFKFNPNSQNSNSTSTNQLLNPNYSDNLFCPKFRNVSNKYFSFGHNIFTNKISPIPYNNNEYEPDDYNKWELRNCQGKDIIDSTSIFQRINNTQTSNDFLKKSHFLSQKSPINFRHLESDDENEFDFRNKKMDRFRQFSMTRKRKIFHNPYETEEPQIQSENVNETKVRTMVPNQMQKSYLLPYNNKINQELSSDMSYISPIQFEENSSSYKPYNNFDVDPRYICPPRAFSTPIPDHNNSQVPNHSVINPLNQSKKYISDSKIYLSKQKVKSVYTQTECNHCCQICSTFKPTLSGIERRLKNYYYLNEE